MPSRETQSSTVSHVDPEDIQKFEECIARVKSLKGVSAHRIGHVSDTERDIQEVTEIMNFYQEQPHVLEPHLQKWIDLLLPIALSEDTSQMGINIAFNYLYLLTKVRGQKYIVRLFPHEVSDLEVVLKMLESEKSDIWHARYILFLWLSILVLIPFDLTRLDGDKESGYTVRRMLKIATLRLEGSDISSSAAGLVVAKLVTRPDLYKEHLRPTIESIFERCKEAERDAVFGAKTRLGNLGCLARIYKLGRREYVLENSEYVLEQLKGLELRLDANTLLRRNESKLIQRIGLSFLVPRVAKWRYQRGTRVLADSLKGESVESTGKPEVDEQEDEEEDYDIPEEIEDVLDTLFRCLKDSETIVRWSAAKGIGRITARLPKSLATDIVSTLLECFTPLESCDSWHGGCLALAELGRYGYLLPEHLPLVVPILIKSLQYDERRGNIALGTNVRDAACYLSWSFARTYDPVQIRPFVKEISNALILTTLFDRYINCRRAASAAFQENVGRQGSFPYGIDILTTCDYYSVALQTNTYHKLSVKVAEFEPYRKGIIDHLAENRAVHWCPSIRRDASIALKNLCSLDAEYISSEILNQLLDVIDKGDFNGRHGALQAIGNICVGLLEQGKLNLVSQQQIDRINSVVRVIDERGSFRGSGGDEMRHATCYFIERTSAAGITLSRDTLLRWQGELDLSLVNPEHHFGVQAAAVAALGELAGRYYTCEDNSTCFTGLVERYVSQLDNELAATRVGSAYALSVLPGCVLRPFIDVLIMELGQHTKVLKKSDLSLAECRVSSVKAIGNVFVTCEPNAQQRLKIYDILLECLDDYSTDSRGDIGSFVREAAMEALRKINDHVIKQEPHIVAMTLTKDLKRKIVCGLVQQSVEKIDRTRHVAITTLHRFVYLDIELEHHDVLKVAVPPIKDGLYVNGTFSDAAEYYNASHVFTREKFNRSMELIPCSTYVKSLMRGLVVTLGGLTESLVKASSDAFVGYLSEREEYQSIVLDAILSVMETDQRNDRVIVPLFKTVELILTNIILDDEIGSIFCVRFIPLVKKELFKCGNVAKLLCVIDPLTNCLQFTNSKPTLNQLMLLLCHRYPRVRKRTADALYTALVSYEDLIPDADRVTGIVEATVWENPNNMEKLREERNKICEILQLPIPKLVVGSKPKPAPTQNTEQFDSYSDLVGRVGY